MKRIKIETADRTFYAKPLTLGQLEEHEDAINEIGALGAEVRAQANADIPLDLLKKQAAIVLIGLKNHDPNLPDDTVNGFSATEIPNALTDVLYGSGLVEVEAGNAVAGV